MSSPENPVYIPVPQACVHFDTLPAPSVITQPERASPSMVVEHVAGPVTVGACGPAPGIDFPFVPPIDFAFGDASSVRWTAPVAGRFVEVRVDIDTAFNGTGAALRVGVLGDVDALMSATQNNPYEVAAYSATTEVSVAAGASLWFEINPGSGASQGAGTLHVTFVPEN